MTKELTKKAKQFWEKQQIYPNYSNIKTRRLYEINYLVPKIHKNKFNTILDLGCGNGDLIKCLEALTEVENYYAYEYSENLLNCLPDNNKIIKKVYDCTNPVQLPVSDLTIFSGVAPFIFDDQNLEEIFSLIKSDYLFFKSPFSLEEEVLVDKFSDELNSHYCSKYRNIENVLPMIKKYFKIIEINKIYPEGIESKFSTKQIAFWCEKR
jgi:SAM-dependent methyltransferase